MDNSAIILLLDEGVSVVSGHYEPVSDTPTLGVKQPKQEFFKTRLSGLVKGDLIVVETNTRHGFTVVKVHETDVQLDLDTTGHLRWAVSRLDRVAYDQMIEQEQRAISAVQESERRRKREELREQMLKDMSEEQQAQLMLGPVVEPPETPPST